MRRRRRGGRDAGDRARPHRSASRRAARLLFLLAVHGPRPQGTSCYSRRVQSSWPAAASYSDPQGRICGPGLQGRGGPPRRHMANDHKVIVRNQVGAAKGHWLLGSTKGGDRSPRHVTVSGPRGPTGAPRGAPQGTTRGTTVDHRSTAPCALSKLQRGRETPSETRSAHSLRALLALASRLSGQWSYDVIRAHVPVEPACDAYAVHTRITRQPCALS